jgi:protein TonB
MTHGRPPEGPLPGPRRHPPKRSAGPRIALLNLPGSTRPPRRRRAEPEPHTQTRRPAVAHNCSPRAAAVRSVSRSHGASVSAGGGARGTGPGGTGEGGSGPGPSSSPGGPGSRPAPQVRPATTPDPPPPPKPKRSQADLSRFRSMVQARITGARRYPSSARDADQHGTVRVSFRVSPGGQPSGISVASSSGYQSLDAAARRAVSAAGPYRPFPKHMSSSIRVTATVIFRLN